jgi:energy-coupling factor transporter ATP-binding protein EcfA2
MPNSFLLENTSNVLEDWKPEMDVFYETMGTAKVLDKIWKNNIVMIIGNSGEGKSATMKYASFLLKNEGFEVIPVSSANDIPFQRFSDRKQLFVIDDIFGKYRLDSVAFETWRRLNDRLKVIFRDKNVKLLCTLRRQLKHDIGRFLHETIFDAVTVELDSYDLSLSKSEKKGIFKKHLSHRNIEMQFDDDSIQKICECAYAFPLMCKLFASNSNYLNRKTNFFTSPSVIFKEELDHLQEENNEVYCALVLIVIFDCKEIERIFDITCEIDRRDCYNLILQACGVGESISRTHLYKRLLSVSGVFVECHNPFEFIHDEIENIIAFHFGSSFPKTILRCCKSAFLREQIGITGHEMDDENVLIIEKTNYDALSERILLEILKGKFHDILLSEPLQNRDFVDYWLSYIKEQQMTLHQLECIRSTDILLPSYLDIRIKFWNAKTMKTINKGALAEVFDSRKRTFIYWVAAAGNHLLFHHIFERPKGIARRLRERFTVINDLLHTAVPGGNIDIVKSLIRMGANVNSCDKYSIPLLTKVSGIGPNQGIIADLLIGEGATHRVHALIAMVFYHPMIRLRLARLKDVQQKQLNRNSRKAKRTFPD